MGSMASGIAGSVADEPAETLHQSTRTRVVRVGAGGGSRILKQPLGNGAAERVRLERAMLQRLAGVPGILQPRAESPAPNTLVFDDPGGVSLSRLLTERALDAGEVLRLGLALARILANVHRRGVLHKDINPANVLVGTGPMEAWLIDFDLATAFAEERLAFAHLSELSGTLPYMAPEQTGRTGRLLDWRADLYSLGATLYAAVTGKPPFEGNDPLQLVHDHLATAPRPPEELDPRVPRNFSRIVMRLLEKEPDARYQSADGLVIDLARAYELWLSSRDTDLVLGERDFPARLRPPSRLMGRDAELLALRRAFDEVAHGACGMVLVSGAPGVGKSALIDEVRAWVTPAGGLYAAGKFDALQQDAEADGVRQALRATLRLLLAEPETELDALRGRLRNALGMNAPLAAALLPEVAHLLQLDAQRVAPSAARQTRTSLQQITQLLLRALARPGRPIVLVVDDLQWAPRAALDMLDAVHLDEDMRGVLILASYRHAEVDSSHPLRAQIARWKRLGLAPREVHLEDLRPVAVAEMLGECLRLSEHDARSLAEAIRPLTGGNPFDTLELIDSLRRDGLLRLEPEGWRWDPERIHQHLEGRNVEALVAQRLQGLAPATARLLDAMACVGGVVPLTRLAVAAGIDLHALDEVLSPALHEGLLMMDRAQGAAHFRHDRVLQSLASRLSNEERTALQVQVARRLAADPAHAGVAAEIYLQVAAQLDAPRECASVAALFRAAAVQARLSVNWTQIERFAREGLSLLRRAGNSLDDDTAHELRLRHSADLHAALYGLGRLADADGVYRDILVIASDPLQRADSCLIQITSLTQRDRPGDAVQLALDLLRDLGLEVPATREAFEAAVANDLDELYDWLAEDREAHIARPECRDPRALAIARTLTRSMPPSFYSDHLVMAWMISAAARLWRLEGASSALIGPLSHAAFATIAFRADHRGGHDIVERVLQVATARNYELDGAQGRFSYALSCAHWVHPLEHGVAEARSAQELLLRAGELHFGFGAYNSLLKNLVDCAASLEELESAASIAVDSTRRIGNEQAGATFIAYRQFARSLRGSTDTLGSFSDDSFDEAGHVARLAANPVGMSNYRIVRALSALIAGDFDTLVAQMDAVQPLLRYTCATYFMAVSQLLQALALAHRARACPPGVERDALVQQLEARRDWHAARAIDSPENFAHLLEFIQAELAWVRGDFHAAALAYDAAWEHASERPRFWHRAAILEQSARCRQAHGIHRTAGLLLQRARAEYAAWGAEGKCKAMGPNLDDEAPSPVDSTRHPGSHRSGSMRGGEIDLLAMLKAAQALQSETDPDKLLDNVGTVVSALSGATAVRLALWSEESRTWFVDEKMDGGMRRQVPFEKAVEERLLPSTAFRYAQRTREPLVVDDALTDERFRRDPYFTGLQRCSLLVVPVLSRGTLKAMLLLENRKAQSVFSSHRLDGVLLIASQLATSLENARLSESIERRVAMRVQTLGEDNERLVQLSNTDALTGIANRRRLDTVFSGLIADAARRGEPIAIAMVDVDHFKLFNDRYGHQAGDECLTKIARWLRDSARDSDLVARYGGEEFAIVLPGTNLEVAFGVAERMRAYVQAQALPHEQSPHRVITLSVGVGALIPTGPDAAARLMRLADEALYAAKGQGRNRAVAIDQE